MTTTDILDKYKEIHNARIYRKKFIPLEKIAINPAGYGYPHIEPVPDSRARQEDFLSSKTKITAAISANRSGKSEIMAIRDINIWENQRSSGEYWILTESYDMQRSGIQKKLIEYIKPENIIDRTWAKKGVWGSIKYQNKAGAIIDVIFHTYEQGASKLQSAKLIGASFDEEPPEDVYDEVYMRTIDLTGPINMAFTPLHGYTWSYHRLLNARSKNISVFNWGIYDNPFIPRSEIEEMKATMSPKKWKMRGLGLYQGSEGMVYEVFDRSIHVKKNLFDEYIPVDVSIDWGVVCAAVTIWQSKKIQKLGRVVEEHYLVNAMELSNMGYGQVMTTILRKGYIIDNWFCDPAGRQRNQTSRTGSSLLAEIKKDFGISFQYIKSLGVEESIDLVNSMLMNEKQEVRLYIQEGIKLNERGDGPEMRIEHYVRDDETGQPVKDGVSDHWADSVRYYIANKIRGQGRGIIQH